MRRAGSYREAIAWIAYNDDTTFLTDPERADDDTSASVSVYLVADVFGRTVQEALKDLRAALKRRDRETRRAQD